MAVAAVVAAGCTTGAEFRPLPVPESVPSSSTATTASPDYSGVVLAPVEGTTTTTEVVVGPGPAVLGGRVEGPDGPVAGATVRLERLVADAVAVLDVLTAADGTWTAPDVLGGRYRIRAWRQPDLAMVEPEILFLDQAGRSDLVLRVERFGEAVVDTAIFPDPPVVGARSNLAVRLSSRTVGTDGVVRTTPRAGLAVTLSGGGAWAVEVPATATSDAAGRVTFTVVCRLPGAQSLTVSVAASEVVPLTLPECVAPPPSTTQPPPSTTPTTSTPTSSTTSTSRP